MSTILDELHQALGIHDELSQADERKRIMGLIAEIEQSELVAHVTVSWVSDFEQQQELVAADAIIHPEDC